MWCTLHLNNSYLSTPSLGLPLNAFLDYTTHHTPDPEVSKETEHTGEVPYPSTPFKRTQREKQIHHAHLWVSHVFKPNKKLDFFLLSCALLTSSLTNLQTFLRNSEQSCYKSPGHPGEREREKGKLRIRGYSGLAASFVLLFPQIRHICDIPKSSNMLRSDGELSWRPVTKYLSSCFCWLQLILLFMINLFIFLYLRISYLCTMKCIYINLYFPSNFTKYYPKTASPNFMSFSIFD